MDQLQPENYDRVRPLFQSLRYNLVVDSILEGNTPAWIFVDHADTPRSALMWNRQDAMMIAGDPTRTAFSEAVADCLDTRIIPDATRRYIPELSLHYDSNGWREQSRVILKDKAYHLAGRRFYTLDRLRVDWHDRIDQGFQMVRLDESLLTDRSVKNVEHVAGWVASYWRSFKAFVETSFGYAVLTHDADGKTVVTSWCLAVYVSGRDFELGLATMPDYRHRGLATLAAAASVEHCLQRGWTPHWHCWSDNAGSKATAARVGFDRPVPYVVYRIPLT